MARCYHDKHDFISDLNIEVAREGDILEANQDLKDIKCDKNHGHEGFIPFKDLKLKHLPIGDRSIETLDVIERMGSRVVRLVVGKLKNGRRKKSAGSGCVYKFLNGYIIQTNNHVVKTEDEVKHCTVEFHYDSTDNSSVLSSRGVELLYTCPFRDFTAFWFHPVPDCLHQLDIQDRLDNQQATIVLLDKNTNEIGTAVSVTTNNSSHSSSPISFFSRQNLNSLKIHLMFMLSQDGSISYLKSSYFKFQPIPSNIQELTSIQIYIDEDDGMISVMQGDVVQFGDEFVVNLTGSIFQDEVKKCRLVWNGEVIGRGTRLYFKQVKTCDIFSGVDLDHEIEQGIDNLWLYEFHPIPRELEEMHQTNFNMCCIGHPHGGSKMVTFGHELNKSIERFDNQNRRIAQPDKNCQCKEVNCVNYTCKTCPGSSGSQVFVLCKGMRWGGNHLSHFMGRSVKPFKSNGELVENINTAWTPFPHIKN